MFISYLLKHFRVRAFPGLFLFEAQFVCYHTKELQYRISPPLEL